MKRKRGNKIIKNKIYHGDCLEVLKKFPDKYIDMCVTSPPYYGLRDYKSEGQIGLEETPEEYVQKIVEIFREVKRVLKNNGTLWLNLGDSYWGGGWKGSNSDLSGTKQNTNIGVLSSRENLKKDIKHPILKQKDLVGIPWMVAFALRVDGWYLRQDIIWNKPNPFPEGVKDRCTKAHEYIFLLSKSKKYYYDMESIKEDSIDIESYIGRRKRNAGKMAKYDKKHYKMNVNKDGFLSNTGKIYEKRNKRSVWTVHTKSYKGAHFATYPERLIKPCILAGCPENGIVLDPFMGAGTTAVVCKKLHRNWIGIELNEKYIQIAENRINKTKKPLFIV